MSRRSSEARFGKPRKNGLAAHSGEWQGFVDLPLTDAEKDRLASAVEEDFPDVGEFLSECLADGYKFSAVTDEKHSCVIATLTGKSEGCENAGFSLSARGPDLERAVLVLYFKHVVVCERLRWAGHDEGRNNQLSLWG